GTPIMLPRGSCSAGSSRIPAARGRRSRLIAAASTLPSVAGISRPRRRCAYSSNGSPAPPTIEDRNNKNACRARYRDAPSFRCTLNDETTDKLRWLSGALQRISELTGRGIAWLTLPMVAGTFVIVVLRYAFDLGYIWMQEGVVWLHAAAFMLAAAYTLKHDEHVRVD